MIVSLPRQFRGKETANVVLAYTLPLAFSNEHMMNKQQISDKQRAHKIDK